MLGTTITFFVKIAAHISEHARYFGRVLFGSHFELAEIRSTRLHHLPFSFSDTVTRVSLVIQVIELLVHTLLFHYYVSAIAI